MYRIQLNSDAFWALMWAVIAVAFFWGISSSDTARYRAEAEQYKACIAKYKPEECK